MKRTLSLLALILAGVTPMYAQTNEFGVILGGSRRFVDSAPHVAETDFIESNWALGNGSVELYWNIPIEPDLNLKFKGGRIETQVSIPYTPSGSEELNRRDVEGQVQHIETAVEYRFDEPFGSSGLFAGLGFYRLTAPQEDTQQTWGVTAGVNSDFPITRRYGVVLEAAYHWTHAEFEPRYLTVGAGLRVKF